jgi:uroporphyrin-III C-methyltransferase
MTLPGTVYLLGAGPGAADLLTVRAVRLLERADIVFHDALVHPDTLALAPQAIKIAVGKRCGRHSTAQHFINKQLIDAARKHAVVVRLKGGDPMIFGRSQEEIDALTTAGIAVEVVPGITAVLAAAADLRTSLTQRGVSRSVTLATPRVGSGKAESDWSAALSPTETSAIYMAAHEAEKVAATLRSKGFPEETPVVLVESASLPQRRSIQGKLRDLGTMATGLGDGPALILIGESFRKTRMPAAAQTAPGKRVTAG